MYSGGDGGWEIVKGATGGYLIGFIVAALLTGWLARRRWDRRFNSASPRCSRGSVVIYLFGLPWLARTCDLDLEERFEAGPRSAVPAGALLPGGLKLVRHLAPSRVRGAPPG